MAATRRNRRPIFLVPHGGMEYPIPDPGYLSVDTLAQGLELASRFADALSDEPAESAVLAHAHAFLIRVVREESPGHGRRLEQLSVREARPLLETALDIFTVRGGKVARRSAGELADAIEEIRRELQNPADREP